MNPTAPHRTVLNVSPLPNAVRLVSVTACSRCTTGRWLRRREAPFPSSLKPVMLRTSRVETLTRVGSVNAKRRSGQDLRALRNTPDAVRSRGDASFDPKRLLGATLLRGDCAAVASELCDAADQELRDAALGDVRCPPVLRRVAAENPQDAPAAVSTAVEGVRPAAVAAENATIRVGCGGWVAASDNPPAISPPREHRTGDADRSERGSGSPSPLRCGGSL